MKVGGGLAGREGRLFSSEILTLHFFKKFLKRGGGGLPCLPLFPRYQRLCILYVHTTTCKITSSLCQLNKSSKMKIQLHSQNILYLIISIQGIFFIMRKLCKVMCLPKCAGLQWNRQCRNVPLLLKWK